MVVNINYPLRQLSRRVYGNNYEEAGSASSNRVMLHEYLNMEKRGNFPARRQLSARSVGWIRHEVEAWIEGLQQVAVPVAVPVAQS